MIACYFTLYEDGEIKHINDPTFQALALQTFAKSNHILLFTEWFCIAHTYTIVCVITTNNLDFSLEIEATQHWYAQLYITHIIDSNSVAYAI